MARDSYFGSGGYTADEQYNATSGGNAPDAILNALNQSRLPSVDDPYGNLLAHATAPKSPFAGGNSPIPTTGTPQPANPATTYPPGWEWLGQFAQPAAAPHSPFGGGNNPIPTTGTPQPSFDQYGVLMNPTDPPAKPPGTEDPRVAAQWYSYWIPSITAQDVSNYRISGFQGNITEWWRAGKPQQQPFLGNPAPNQTQAPWATGKTVNPNVNPNTTPPPSATPPPTGTTGTPVDSQQYLDALNRALDASYNRSLQDTLRSYRADASARDLENTGAYGANAARLQGELGTTFATQKAQAMLGAQEAERGRQFSGEQNSLDRQLQRYGIQVNADTSRANAQTAAGSQQLAAQLQYDLGLKGIDVDRAKLAEQIRNDTLDFNALLSQQDLQRLLAGQTNQLDLYRLLLQYGPEGVFSQLFGQQQPGGFVPYTP